MEESNLEQNPTVQPIGNQTQAPPSSKSKLLLILIIFIFIVVLFSGAYYLLNQSKNANQQKQTSIVPTIAQTSPTQTIDASREPNGSAETAIPDQIGANWKTYTNTKYEFSFKYPSEFKIEKGPADNLPDSAFQNWDNISFVSDNIGRFDISINLKDANGIQIQCVSDDECLQKWLDVLKITPPDEVIPKLSIKIFGKDREGFEHIVRNKLYTQGFENYVFIEKGIVWNVGLPGQGEQKKTNSEQLFDQILSTFRFAN